MIQISKYAVILYCYKIIGLDYHAYLYKNTGMNSVYIDNISVNDLHALLLKI